MTADATQGDSYTRNPNWTYDLMPVVTPAQYKVISAAVRLTYGWHQEWTDASAQTVADMTGMNRTTVSLIFNTFVEVGLIDREPGPRNSYRWRLVPITPAELLSRATANLLSKATDDTATCRLRQQLPVVSDNSHLLSKATTHIKEERKSKERKERECIAPAAPTPVASADEVQSVPATQQTLSGLPEHPTPVPAPPSPPARAKKAGGVPPEVAAIRQALKDAAEWGPSAKANAQAKQAGDRLMEFAPDVTPEQIAGFAREWFPRYSPQATSAARRGDPLTPPTPEQIVQLWPRFQPWWQARQDELTRRAEQARRRREERPAEIVRDARPYNPFRSQSRPIPVATD